jgi:hypothetical protein
MKLICPDCHSTLYLSLAEKLAGKNDFVCIHCKSELVFRRPHSEVTYLVMAAFLGGGVVYSWFTPIVKFLLLTTSIILLYLYDFSRVRVQLAPSQKTNESNKNLIPWILASAFILISALILFLKGNGLYLPSFLIGIVIPAIGILNFRSLFSKNKLLSSAYVFLYLILMHSIFLALKFDK